MLLLLMAIVDVVAVFVANHHRLTINAVYDFHRREKGVYGQRQPVNKQGERGRELKINFHNS